jgi:hypothetical protein
MNTGHVVGKKQGYIIMNKKKGIRKQFRDEVFARDGYKCVFCGETLNLDAHHITDRHNLPAGGYVKENGITLCSEHHLKVENYIKDLHTIDIYCPRALYEKIGSSKELAVMKSLELSLKDE